jgi:squalene cyclase
MENGITFLQNTQHEDGLWQDEIFTGGGFPH